VFLKPDTPVLATFDHDYPEWHKGRSEFSLWYLEILDVALLNYLEKLRTHFSDFLYTPNTRQFHITLFICGFLSSDLKKYDDDFSQIQLQTHIDVLNRIELPNFKLRTRKINSFESALFVEIEDEQGILKSIRNLLAKLSTEIAPLEYCPHITLGLYQKAVTSDEIFRRISQIDQQEFDLGIDHLTFGVYQAHILQGPLQVLHQQHLGIN
jgi:2'-5' RNA ligase